MRSRTAFAEAVPELLVPAPRFGEAPSIEMLARSVAVVLLLAAWVVAVVVTVDALVPDEPQDRPIPVRQVVDERRTITA